jgi:hypothetical protein
MWISLDPLTPLGVLRGNFGKPSFEVFPLDAHKTLSIRIPEATRLSVIEHEGVIIGPTGGYEGQCLIVYLAAVHSR